MLLQPDSQTLLFSRLDRLSAALEVLRYLLLIYQSFSLIVHWGENFLFVVTHAISECDLLVDCETVECFSVDYWHMYIHHFLVFATHFFDLRNVRHTRIWTKVFISSLAIVRRLRARIVLSVIELVWVIHHQSIDIQVECCLRELDLVRVLTFFTLASDQFAEENGV